jgi:hypothetical protein
MYYSHYKPYTAIDYIKDNRSCGLGGAQKTDFANPNKLGINHRSQVSPVTYMPVSSSAKRCSPMDGFAHRCGSPIATACRILAEEKARKQSSPRKGKGGAAASKGRSSGSLLGGGTAGEAAATGGLPGAGGDATAVPVEA